MPFSPRLRGFSLLELLIVIALVAIVLVLGGLGMGHLRERSQSYRCIANLKQIGAATMFYVAEHQGNLPYYFYADLSGATGSGAVAGSWFYNLAPYLHLPRTEFSHDGATTERTYLGTAENRIAAPCVVTCPGHRTTESDLFWKPTPMSWPATRPVSYAPPLDARGNSPYNLKRRSYRHRSGVDVYPYKLSDVTAPARKIWISDSPHYNTLNTVESRWRSEAEDKSNWAYQAFSRHHHGGNALFYDGHVEWLSLETFTKPKNGSVINTLRLYFNPYREPHIDE